MLSPKNVSYKHIMHQLMKSSKHLSEIFKICPTWIRTKIEGFKGLCPAIRRSGNCLLKTINCILSKSRSTGNMHKQLVKKPFKLEKSYLPIKYFFLSKLKSVNSSASSINLWLAVCSKAMTSVRLP